MPGRLSRVWWAIGGRTSLLTYRGRSQSLTLPRNVKRFAAALQIASLVHRSPLRSRWSTTRSLVYSNKVLNFTLRLFFRRPAPREGRFASALVALPVLPAEPLRHRSRWSLPCLPRLLRSQRPVSARSLRCGLRFVAKPPYFAFPAPSVAATRRPTASFVATGFAVFAHFRAVVHRAASCRRANFEGGVHDRLDFIPRSRSGGIPPKQPRRTSCASPRRPAGSLGWMLGPRTGGFVPRGMADFVSARSKDATAFSGAKRG